MRSNRGTASQFGTLILCLTIGSLVLGACGSPTKKPPARSTTTTTTTKHISLASCSTALLGIKATFGGTAAGGSYYRFSATNSSPKTCSISGYPKLAFFAPNAAGGAGSDSSVAMTVTNSGASPTTLKLKTSATAEFLMTYTDVPVNGEGCSAVGSVNVTPPHQSESSPVAISFSPCGGVVKVQAFAQPGTENP